MDAQTLAIQYNLNKYVTDKNVEGVTHADSLLSPEKGGSCMNWILGHVIKARAELLTMIGKPAMPPEDYKQYRGNGWTTSEFRPFEELVETFDSLQDTMLAALGSLTAEQMNQKAPFSPVGNPDETVGSLITTFVFHETYHLGQLGILRRHAGKPGVLSPPAEVA